MLTAHFVVEVPRGSLVKWGADGGIDFLSPIPCPFNYGSIPSILGADGDPLDVIVLGPRLKRGAAGALPIRACARFIDSGTTDDKWVCSAQPLRDRERLLLSLFFHAYALPKSLKSSLLSQTQSRFLGLEEDVSSLRP